MKKKTALFLAFIMALCRSSCGGQAARDTGSAAESAKPTEAAGSKVTETPTPEVTKAAEESKAESAAAEVKESSETAEAPETVSKLNAVFNSMDPDAGIHMSYDMVTPVYPDHPTHIDIHCKGRSFYRLDSVVGLEAYDSIALIMDGQRYRLNEEDKTYIVYEDYIEPSDLMAADPLYVEMKFCKDRTDFTTGETELNGQTYASEFYPENSTVEVELTFCFREDGSLAGVIEMNPMLDGTITYSINALDDQADESLFTYSGYTLKGQ